MNFSLCHKIEKAISLNTNIIRTKELKFEINSKYLMRDYIQHKLYDENLGYYSPKNSNAIGRLENPLNFKEMRGLSDYSIELNKKYPKSTWMTCPELLRPYFGFSLGNYIDKNFKVLKDLKKVKENNNIKIFEVGCGMGAAIDSILDYLRTFNIKEYRDIEYVGFELNPAMAKFTEDLLKKNHPDLHENNQIKIFNCSIFDIPLEMIEEENIYILGINFFNSTPHDKILLDKNWEKLLKNELKHITPFGNTAKLSDNDLNKLIHEHYKDFLKNFLIRNPGIIKQTSVEVIDIDKDTGKKKFTQNYSNLTDEKIIDMFTYYILPEEIKEFILGERLYNLERTRHKKSEDWFIKSIKNFYFNYNNENKMWINTSKDKFFSQLEANMPNGNLILLDFDILPSKIFNCDYKGKNAPVVYSIIEDSYDTKTYSSIFESWESSKLPVNIYFPVDFENLQLYGKIKNGKDFTLNKFKYFMNVHSMNEWCESKSGFNPLIDTHHNTTFMLNLI